MKLYYLNLLKFFPFRPIIKIQGKRVRPSYKDLYRMYKRADYVARVIDQALDLQPIVDRGALMTILYLAVHHNLKYLSLCSVIKIVAAGREVKI